MRTSLVLLFTGLLAAQTVQVPSPKQGRPGEILPFTRFRPRTDPYKPTAEEKQKIQAKIDELAAKANHGTLTLAEKEEYDNYLAAYHLITVLQARATQLLRA